jgi:hypothetical protein
MALSLPIELGGLATTLGLSWPDADEDALHALAADWAAVAEDLRTGATGSALAVRRLLVGHPDGDLDGFAAAWAGGPARLCTEAVLAAQAMAACLTTMAAVVLELKVFAVGRLAALAAAMAAHPAHLAAAPPGAVATAAPDAGAGTGTDAGVSAQASAALAAQAAAAIATRAALRRAQASAAAVVDNSVVPVLHAAERRLRGALGPGPHPSG